MIMERCGRCRGEGYCMTDCGWATCRECGGDGYIDPYMEDEWYDDNEEVEYYYGEPDIQFAPIHLHTAHPRLFRLEGARVDVWKPEPLWMRYQNKLKRGK